MKSIYKRIAMLVNWSRRSCNDAKTSNHTDLYYWRIFGTGFSFIIFALFGLLLGYILFPLIALLTRDSEMTIRRCRLCVSKSFGLFVLLMKTLGVLSWEANGAQALSRAGQLIVANHPTLIDIVLLIAMIPNACCAVKSGLMKNVFTRRPLIWAGYMSNNGGDQFVSDACQELARGGTIIMFPEGTRSDHRGLHKFKRGAANICIRSDCDVILVKITCNPPTLAKHERWHQIPAKKPHFNLIVNSDYKVLDEYKRMGVGRAVRALTHDWYNYFLKELAI